MHLEMAKKLLTGHRGYTFVEAVTTIAILGILSSVAYVNLAESEADIRANVTVKKMVSDIRYAQELAMTSGREVRVYVDEANNRYSLRWATGAYVENPLGSADFIVQLGEGHYAGIQITETEFTNGRLDFDSKGFPYNSGNALSESAALAVFFETVQVRITPNTGRVYLISG